MTEVRISLYRVLAVLACVGVVVWFVWAWWATNACLTSGWENGHTFRCGSIGLGVGFSVCAGAVAVGIPVYWLLRSNPSVTIKLPWPKSNLPKAKVNK